MGRGANRRNRRQQQAVVPVGAVDLQERQRQEEEKQRQEEEGRKILAAQLEAKMHSLVATIYSNSIKIDLDKDPDDEIEEHRQIFHRSIRSALILGGAFWGIQCGVEDTGRQVDTPDVLDDEEDYEDAE